MPTVVKTTFLLRRGLSTEWASVNPILKTGEPGFETDTGKLKIGRNNLAWNDLDYYGGEVSIEADGKTIVLDNGTIMLSGYEEALEGQSVRKGKDGLEWFQPATAEELQNIYTKDEINILLNEKVAGAFRYKGSVSLYEDLPKEGNQIGDVWNIEVADGASNIKAGDNVAWNGTGWDVLAGIQDFSFLEDKINAIPNVLVQSIQFSSGKFDIVYGEKQEDGSYITKNQIIEIPKDAYEFTAEEKAQLASIPMLYATEEEVDDKIARAVQANGIIWERIGSDDSEAQIGKISYSTLKQAVAAAKPGDIITVNPGTYSIEFTKATSPNLTIVGGNNVFFSKIRFAETTNYKAPDNLTLKNINFNGEGIAGVSGKINNLSIINSNFIDGAVIHTNVDCSINGLLIKDCDFDKTDSSVNVKEKTAILIQSPSDNVIIIDNNIKNCEHNAIQMPNIIGTVTIDGNIIDNIGSRAIRLVTKDNDATLIIKNNTISTVNTNPAEAEENDGEVIKITGVVTDGILSQNTYNNQLINFIDGIGR